MFPWCVYVCPLEDLYPSQGRSQDFSKGKHNSPNATIPPPLPSPLHQGKVTVSLSIYDVSK